MVYIGGVTREYYEHYTDDHPFSPADLDPMPSPEPTPTPTPTPTPAPEPDPTPTKTLKAVEAGKFVLVDSMQILNEVFSHESA